MKTNKIYHGECREVMKTFPDNCIDLTVTSPPYDNLRTYNGYTFDFEGIAQQLYRVTKEGGVVVWVVGDATINGSETLTSFKQALYFKEIGFMVHDTMIYQKSSFSNPSNNRYHQVFEYMFVFSKGDIKTFNQIKDRENIYHSSGKATRQKDGTITKIGERVYYGKYGMRFNVWRYATGKGVSTKSKIAFKHPAIFPEKLANDHIISWSNKGDLILDPFCGSGTTPKMAIENDRNYIGIEISEKYIPIIETRIKNAEPQLF